MSGGAQAPTRTCVGCGRRGEQHGLLCLQADGDGGLAVVAGRRRRPGRSAYVHGRRECVDRLTKGRLLARSLRATVEPAAREDAVVRLRELLLRGGTTNGQGASEQFDS